MVVGLPCAVRGAAHMGGEGVVAADVAVPHDSGVSADAERARVCNIDRPLLAYAGTGRADPQR